MQFIYWTRVVRIQNIIILVATMYSVRYGIMYPAFLQEGLELLFPESKFLLLVIANSLVAAAGYIINDYFDLRTDRVNRPMKIIVGKYISRRTAMFTHVILNILGIFIGIYLAYFMGNWKLAFFQLLPSGLLWYYSIWFKRQPFIGNLIIAFLTALIPVSAGLYELAYQDLLFTDVVNSYIFFTNALTLSFSSVAYHVRELLIDVWYLVAVFSGLAFLLNILREFIKDIEDMRGDYRVGMQTLPIIMGRQTARYIGIALLGIYSLVTLYFVKQFLGAGNIVMVIYIVASFLIPFVKMAMSLKKAKKSEQVRQVGLSIKMVMIMGILFPLVYNYQDILANFVK